MNSINKFQKPPLSIEKQIERLKLRGLIIQDKLFAQHQLTFISYFRFCGYGLDFQNDPNNGDKRYIEGITFEQILESYEFDRQLRLLIIDAIERIEIAIRTVINNELAIKHGAHWYTNKYLFLPNYNHNDLIKAVEKETQFNAQANSPKYKRREKFIQHYYSKYPTPELPPSWMISEVLSLGTWSMVFANLINRDDQKIICSHFNISYKVMESWLHSLTYLRNLCAHHSKIWSRHFTVTPMKAKEYCDLFKEHTKFSAQVAVLKILINAISPQNQWVNNLQQLIYNHKAIDVTKMGFKEGIESFWIN